MTSESDNDITVGNEIEWQRFSNRHQGFLEESHRLTDLANKVLDRTLTRSTLQDRVVFSFGFLIFDDFTDILTLVGNGRGFGGQKILRGMYERIVTLGYLLKHLDAIDDFVDYEQVRLFKAFSEIASAVPSDDANTKLAERKTARDAVMTTGRFVRRCKCRKDCQEVLDGISWTPLSLPDQAVRAGDGLRDDLLASYLTPLTETHPTFISAAARQEETATGSTYSKMDDKSRAVVDTVLVLAHKYALMLLKYHISYFSDLAPLQDELDKRATAFNTMHASRPVTETAEA